MGIVNATPDSFSDGGSFLDTDAAVARALECERQGAAIIDIGGESTRPGAPSVPLAEELRRVIPVIERLAGRLRAAISVDTMKPEVARAATAAGASIINDVAANREDGEMWQVAAAAGAGYVCLHMRGTPPTMQQAPVYQDVAAEVAAFFSDRLERLRRCGVDPAQVMLDPGIGFGKTVVHNLQLLGGLGGFTTLGRPLLVGVSRKSFLAAVGGGAVDARLPAGLACASLAAAAGVAVIRTHDVAETVQALRITAAILEHKRT